MDEHRDPETGVGVASRARRPAAAALVLAVSLLVGTQPAVATGGGANNVVLVHNTVDAAAHTRGHVSVARVGGPTVATENVAIAEGSCTGCRTIAAAVQVVLGWGEVTDYRPANFAGAVNGGCSGCETLAYAYQHVMWADRPVALGAEAASRIAALRAQVDAATSSGASLAAIEAQLDALSAELTDVVRGEIARAGATASEDPRRRVGRFAA